MFDSSFFIENRTRLRQLFTGTAPIVMTANGLLQKSADEAYLFHQDPNFWYLTGVDEPDAVLVMDKNKEYLIIPEREAVRAAFDGAIDAARISSRSGITEIYNEKQGWKLLDPRLKKVKNVATLGANPPYIEFFGMYVNPARAALIAKLKKANPDLELLDLRSHLGRMRMVKQQVELEVLQQAITITCETLKDVTKPRQFAKYANEYELEADIAYGFRRRGARGHAFPPVVAGGERGCQMHRFENDSPLSSGELVVMDVGACVDHYAADLTRTVALGQPSRRQQQVYEAALEAQEFAFSLLKPGLVLRKDYEDQMEQFIGEKLRELGLIKSIEHDTVRKYFPHATSHFLGLDVHDAGDYERPLEPNVVLAVEPGIYIPEEGIGVRLEDNVRITESGVEILSASLPRALN